MSLDSRGREIRPVAAITGASSGIGQEFARQLARNHDLLLVARRRSRLEAIAEELGTLYGTKIEIVVADLANEENLSVVARRILDEKNLTLLVNNAGFGIEGYFWDADLSGQERMHRLHVLATLKLTHAALSNFVPRNVGAVINVSSVAAFAWFGNVSYGATKAWMKAFDRAQPSSQSWMAAEEVVRISLAGLRRRKHVVVPGWRNKFIVAAVPAIPSWLRFALMSKWARREHDVSAG